MLFISFEESIDYLIKRMYMNLNKNLENFVITKKRINNYYMIKISYIYTDKKFTCQLTIVQKLNKDLIDECINKLILQIEDRF